MGTVEFDCKEQKMEDGKVIINYMNRSCKGYKAQKRKGLHFAERLFIFVQNCSSLRNLVCCGNYPSLS